MASPASPEHRNARWSASDSGWCLRANRLCARRTLRLYFAAMSRLGDGLFWYALMVAMVLLDGLNGLKASAHLAATGVFALLISLVVAKPEFTGRAVGYAVASGVLGAVIVGSISVAAGQAGVARALSLVIAAQLIAGLVLDTLGIFGAGADFSVLKALGVLLIIAGGVLVVGY